MSSYDGYAAALRDPLAVDTIAEGLATGELWVINRHSVTPGGLRWVEDLSWLDGHESDTHGAWCLGTGFVALNKV